MRKDIGELNHNKETLNLCLVGFLVFLKSLSLLYGKKVL